MAYSQEDRICVLDTPLGENVLILTHMSPEMLAMADTLPEECAHDGMVITL